MHNRLKNILALLIGVVFSILILEIFLHIYNPFAFRQKGDKIILPINFNRVYKNPKIQGLDSIIHHSKNSLGFRGEEAPRQMENYTTIIAVGGSTTECYYISDGKDWVTLMNDKLQNELDSVWVNNAGLDGHSTFGHQILLEDYLLKLKPNYILFLIGRNDVGRRDLTVYDKRSINNNKGFKGFVKKNSEIVSIIQNIKRNIAARNQNLSHENIVFSELSNLDSINYYKINQKIQKHKTTINAFENRVNQLVKTCKNNGIEPVLITQPTIVGEGIDSISGIDLESVQLCDDLGGKAYFILLEKYNDITRKIAYNYNILLIDLALEMPKSTVYYYDCVHFTNKGAEKVAEIIYNNMSSKLIEK